MNYFVEEEGESKMEGELQEGKQEEILPADFSTLHLDNSKVDLSSCLQASDMNQKLSPSNTEMMAPTTNTKQTKTISWIT